MKILAKKLATVFLQNERSNTLRRDHRVHGSHYRKTRAFSSLHILQEELLILDVIITRYKYILLEIIVFSRFTAFIYAYTDLFRPKRGDETA